MKLNVLERLMATQLLPEKGDFLTLNIIDDARRLLVLTEAEKEEIDIKQTPNGGLGWNEKGKEDKELALGSAAKEIIKNKLLALDEKKELTNDHISLYKKLVNKEA